MGPCSITLCTDELPKKKNLVEQIGCLDLRSHTKDWISREILFHEDADAVVQHCEPGSEKSVGFRYTRFALIEDESTSDAARGKERPVFNIQYLQVTCYARQGSWTKREKIGARMAFSPLGPLLSGMKGGRICGEDCVQGTETGWKFDQSSPSTFTLPQSNGYTNATELWIKVTADGVFVEHLLEYPTYQCSPRCISA